MIRGLSSGSSLKCRPLWIKLYFFPLIFFSQQFCAFQIIFSYWTRLTLLILHYTLFFKIFFYISFTFYVYKFSYLSEEFSHSVLPKVNRIFYTFFLYLISCIFVHVFVSYNFFQLYYRSQTSIRQRLNFSDDK